VALTGEASQMKRKAGWHGAGHSARPAAAAACARRPRGKASPGMASRHAGFSATSEAHRAVIKAGRTRPAGTGASRARATGLGRRRATCRARGVSWACSSRFLSWQRLIAGRTNQQTSSTLARKPALSRGGGGLGQGRQPHECRNCLAPTQPRIARPGVVHRPSNSSLWSRGGRRRKSSPTNPASGPLRRAPPPGNSRQKSSVPIGTSSRRHHPGGKSSARQRAAR